MLSFREFFWHFKNIRQMTTSTTELKSDVVISRVFHTVYSNLSIWIYTPSMKWDRPPSQYHYIFGRRKWLTEWKWCMVSASFNVMNKARDVLMSVFRARDVDLWDIIWFSLFLKMSLTLNKKAIYQQTEEHHQVYISLCNLLGSDSGSHTSKFQPKNWSPQIFTA